MQQPEKKYVETPLMKQYYDIKAVHPDAVLLFRVGDFYETFGEDAIKASGILGITLTRRANGAATFVELAGFPYHAIDTYLPKLVRAGQRVAICEQLEDPKKVKGLVKRGVIELITPGVITSENTLSAKENVYLAAVYFAKTTVGISIVDISTGEFYVAEGSQDAMAKLIASYAPKEVVYPKGCEERISELCRGRYYTYRLDEWVFAQEVNRDKLMRHFGVANLKGFGIDNYTAGISAAGAVLYYLDFTEHKNIAHINSISRIDYDDYVWMDRFTIRNLELLNSNEGQGRGLLGVIDRTLTAMGGRMLRRWVTMPIKDIAAIRERHSVVRYLVDNSDLSAALAQSVSQIGDLERITSRIAALKVSPRELIQLKNSLASIDMIMCALNSTDCDALLGIAERLDALPTVGKMLGERLFPDPESNQIAKGGVIADGVDPQLDELRRIAFRGKDLLGAMCNKYAEQSGIPSLKISYNNVFGYYIEVRNMHKDKVPQDWVRKQTLANAERYVTEELKEYEQKILGAEEHILAIEQRIYAELLDALMCYIKPLRSNAALVARLDVLMSMASVAIERHYACPDVDDSLVIDIKAGRHPIIEAALPVGEEYVPNDLYLDRDSQQILMITGPNMSGKSALLRQTALIVLMAQIGSFVPAESARIGYIDKIFTRVGASDNISQGESTFMVEMTESATILNNLSDRSLVVFDEIGRGTSTYDGISIAWAIVEYLHNASTQVRPKTLFATHYHELNEMEQSCERVKNFNVSVKEIGNTIIFSRKLVAGGTEHSFGIHVARMAGMPKSLLERADTILENLERAYGGGGRITATESSEPARGGAQCPVRGGAKVAVADPKPVQLSIFQLDDPVLVAIRDQIKGLDINSLTPLEALNKLNEIKKISGL